MSAARSDKPHEPTALIAGIAAFTTWGLIPGYWKLLKAASATEILAHRFVWTSLFLTILLSGQQRWGEVKANARSRRTVLYCLASGSTVSINWFLFIWAVNIERVIETSLGYFMTPLVNVLFGALFFRERLNGLQFASVSLAAFAVFNLTLGYGRFPWVALSLCSSFGLYGLLRKKSGTAAIPGLFFETILLLPIAITYLVLLKLNAELAFGHGDRWLTMLLPTTGIVTAVPLLWFGYAARHLPLTTIGFLQYLAPTGSLLLGVFAYHEPFTQTHLLTFSLIWVALAIFSLDLFKRWRSVRKRAEIVATAAAAESPACR
jgi:chloramphenicol-sensitive protein RarD